MSEVEIETTPENVPEFLEIHVDNLTKDEVIRVKDIKVEGFKIIDDPEQEVAMLTYPHIEKEEPKVETAATEVPEIGKEDKDDEKKDKEE